VTKTARVCAKPGCPEIVVGSTRCEAHALKSVARRPSARAQGYDRKWEAFARNYIRRYPTCCVVGCNSPSKHVDHIDQQGPKGPRGYDPSNLQPLWLTHTTARKPTQWSMPRQGVSTTEPGNGHSPLG
jgi:hypothetical protein